MPRKESEAVPEGNGPFPQDAGKMVRWGELRQAMSKMWGEVFREYKGGLRSLDQPLAGQEEDARQSRLVIMEADGPSDSKTRERTEGATKAVQAMHGISFSANRVQAGPKTTRPVSV